VSRLLFLRNACALPHLLLQIDRSVATTGKENPRTSSGGKKRYMGRVLGPFFSRNPHRVMLRRRHRHPACALTSDDVPVRGAWARHEESNRARCRETERMAPPPCVVASSWKTPRVQLSKVCSCLSQSRWFNHQCADEIQSFQSYIWSRSQSSGSAPPAAYMLIVFTIFFFSCKQA
jgi:hypothetical protein